LHLLSDALHHESAQETRTATHFSKCNAVLLRNHDFEQLQKTSLFNLLLSSRRKYMEILILIVAMIIVGLIIGAIAGAIWKKNRPIGVKGDYLASVIAAIITGLIDWYVIPAMGFSDTMKYIGIALEPPLGALAVLWLIRVAKK